MGGLTLLFGYNFMLLGIKPALISHTQSVSSAVFPNLDIYLICRSESVQYFFIIILLKWFIQFYVHLSYFVLVCKVYV
jgi:hypothetical protein